MPSKRIAILQSSYIPWKGYFDLMRGVDEFVLYDDAQFTKRDWRSRNRIKTPEGLLWLSVPVVVKGRFTQRIDETGLADPDVIDRHWQSIRRAYGRAEHFRDYAEPLERLFATAPRDRLSALNHHFLIGLRDLLGITTPLTWSTAYGGDGSKTARLVDLCVRAGATEYVSGPAARAYIEPALFEAAGITLLYADYAGYPEYPQLHPPFEHAVSVIDLLVHTGAVSPSRSVWPPSRISAWWAASFRKARPGPISCGPPAGTRSPGCSAIVASPTPRTSTGPR